MKSEFIRNYDLVKALQILLMILPQSESFTLLKSRLKCVFYFNSMPKSAESAKNVQKSAFDQQLDAIYQKSLTW